MKNKLKFINLPMTNYFTPNEHQYLKKQKAPRQSQLQVKCAPTEFSLRVIIGYSAALQIFKSKIGNFEILNN